MKYIQEKEAKQKICPFLKENCKGSMCVLVGKK